MREAVGKTGKEAGLIIPFAKMRGETSFASIGVLKCLLGTRKVGHTGTLDSFADGLLVAVSGKLTRLASFIEAGAKRYEARLAFGSETDTLELTGKVVRRAELPTYEKVEEVMGLFVGHIQQVPPQYSALHVAGRRASDIVRSGESVELRPREVEISEIVVKQVLFDGDEDFVEVSCLGESEKRRAVKELHIEVACSKGTYIRALARDIGVSSGSVAHLKALRRLSVACFSLQNAFRSSSLPQFLSEEENDAGGRLSSLPASSFATLQEKATIREEMSDIFTYAKTFSPSLCEALHLPVLEIKKDFVKSFMQGKEIKETWFCDHTPYNKEEKRKDMLKQGVGFVFCEGETLGAISVQSSRYKYKFVL